MHSMNNILAFGHYWRAESLVGFTTISKMIILLSRWQRIQTISKIRIRIFRIGCWHVMNNILAFGPYWRTESLVGTTISQMKILLSRWQKIQTFAKIRIRIFRIGCWHVMKNILAFFGVRTLLKSREPGGHNNITNDDTSLEVAENTDKQKWMWFRHTDRLYGMTALLFLYTTYTSLTK